MKSLFKVENIVKDILSWNPNTREDDFVLIYHVYMVINPLLLSKPFGEVLMLHSHYGLPSFESIFRARRKVQQYNPDLRASKKAIKIRKDTEEYYKFFSKRKELK